MRNATTPLYSPKSRARAPLCAIWLLVLAATPTMADPHEAGALLGAWCDDTGYRIDLAPGSITFLDAQAPNPPPGEELAFAAGIAVYSQDFRKSAWPELDVVSCTLRLTGPDRAEETCTGPGIGYRPFIELNRCTPTPIS